MQKNYTYLIVMIFFILDCNPILAQIVNIPDINFKNYLLHRADINTNKDNEIQFSEAIAFKGSINVPLENIVNLTGISAFANLTSLNCAYNHLTKLDVSANTALMILDCSDNRLQFLDVSNNPSLTKLYCENNRLSAINLKNGNNAAIKSFNVDTNPQLKSIKVDDPAYSKDNWDNINHGVLFD